MNNDPNFFIVGAAKAGTTSIYRYLSKHPDVYMSPIKEPHYFCKDIRCKNFNKSYLENSRFNLDDYLSKHILIEKHIAYIEDELQYLELFRDVKNEKMIGEASTGYLYSKVAAQEIYEFDSHAKIVMVIRNPIDRAFSHWMMDLRDNDVCHKSFIDAIADDQAKKEKGWGESHLYIELGLYFEQIKRYQDVFCKDQILIMLYDDLKDNAYKFYSEIVSFLNLEPINIDTNKRHNAASIPKYPLMNSIIKNLGLNKCFGSILPITIKQNIKKIMSNTDDLPVLTSRDQEQVARYFSDDIEKLEKLITRELSNWLKK